MWLLFGVMELNEFFQKKKGKFQHSSFLAGGATSAAGQLVVEDGTLKVNIIFTKYVSLCLEQAIRSAIGLPT